MRNFVFILFLFTLSCTPMEEPLVEQEPEVIEEAESMFDAIGTHEIMVTRTSYQDGQDSNVSTHSAQFIIESVADSTFSIVLDNPEITDEVSFSFQSTEGIIRYYANHPNTPHLIRYVDYNPIDNSLEGFSCHCFLGGGTTYEWSMQH